LLGIGILYDFLTLNPQISEQNQGEWQRLQAVRA
jgi:hypothetical protein